MINKDRHKNIAIFNDEYYEKAINYVNIDHHGSFFFCGCIVAVINVDFFFGTQDLKKKYHQISTNPISAYFYG